MKRDDRLCKRFGCSKRIDPAAAAGMGGGKVCRIACLRTACEFVNCFGCKSTIKVPKDCLFYMEMLMIKGEKR